FQSLSYTSNVPLSLSIAAQYLDFADTSGNVLTVSDPSGAGGIGASPFVLTTFQPSTSITPQVLTLTGSQALSLTFTYGTTGIQFLATATDLDPSTNNPLTFKLSGTMTETAGANYSFVSTESIPSSSGLTVTGRTSYGLLTVPEPASAPLLLSGWACLTWLFSSRRPRSVPRSAGVSRGNVG
ncbi:MAG TPA: hypothetical protein VHO91_07240, partial [Rhodopila sp.]|nr:hypothetical protein [Rhodopila sp.]